MKLITIATQFLTTLIFFHHLTDFFFSSKLHLHRKISTICSNYSFVSQADKKNKQWFFLCVPGSLRCLKNAFNVSHDTNDTELTRDISCKIHRPRKCLQCFIYKQYFFRWTRKCFTYIHNWTVDYRRTQDIHSEISWLTCV